MDSIAQHRKEVYRARWDLLQKPYLTVEERTRLAELDTEWLHLLRCGDKENAGEHPGTPDLTK